MGAELRYTWFDQLAAREEALIATAHTCLTRRRRSCLFRMGGGQACTGWQVSRLPRQTAAPVPDPRRYRGILCRPWAKLCAGWTNAADLTPRNRIRHTVVPALQSVNPAAEQAIARLCRQMRALDDWLTAEAAALLQAAAVQGRL